MPRSNPEPPTGWRRAAAAANSPCSLRACRPAKRSCWPTTSAPSWKTCARPAPATAPRWPTWAWPPSIPATPRRPCWSAPTRRWRRPRARRNAPGNASTTPAPRWPTTPTTGAPGSTTPCRRTSCNSGCSRYGAVRKAASCCNARRSPACPARRANPLAPVASCPGSNASAGARASTWPCSSAASPGWRSILNRWHSACPPAASAIRATWHASSRC
ncbi:hypothetical protein D3C76_1028330 [compost metagenome]